MKQKDSESSRRLRLAKHVAEKYKQITGIDSIAVGGSTALGSAYSQSDIDMWATYSELPSVEERQKIGCKLIEEYGDEPQPKWVTQGQVDPFRIDGVDVGVMLGHNNDLLQVPDNREQVMGTPREVGISEYYDSVVLYDPKGLWRQVKARLDDYPVSIGEKIINENLDKITTILQDDMLKAVMTQNIFLALEVQVLSLEAFLRILFALNKRYYRRLRDISAVISDFEITPKDCELRLKAWAKERFPSKIRVILLDLVKDILPLIKEGYPDIDIDESVRQLERLSQNIHRK